MRIAVIVVATIVSLFAAESATAHWCGPAYNIANLEDTRVASFKHGRRSGLAITGDAVVGILKCKNPTGVCNGRRGRITGVITPDPNGPPYERLNGTLAYGRGPGAFSCSLSCIVSPESTEPRTAFSCEYFCPPTAAVPHGGFQIVESCF